jgi:3-oxoacyl-[acyl-carrier protein] reductase
MRGSVMSQQKGKIALVTGASRGIGQAIARELAKQGAYVYGTATSKQGAESISEFFAQEQCLGEGLVLDVTSTEQVEHLIEHLTEQDKCPSILVNNAGITADNLLLRMDDEEWYKVIETNLNSIYRMSKACLKPMFRARWGRIISVGSVVGSSGNSGQVNYTAAKAGIIGFSKSLAQEIGSRGITVNVVAPGFIDTDMTRSLPDLVKEEMLKRIPLRRLGDAEDIAATVAFLASDGAKYITGETIHVNGGMYMN